MLKEAWQHLEFIWVQLIHASLFVRYGGRDGALPLSNYLMAVPLCQLNIENKYKFDL